MSSEVGASPQREQTPTSTPPHSSIPQKRAFDDDHHIPAVSSPLNPDFKPARTQTPQDDTPLARDRAPRTKKESLKKRESKAGSGGASHEGGEKTTSDVKSSRPSKKKIEKEIITPTRFHVPPPRLSDFEAPKPPVFTPWDTKTGPEGSEIHFNATSDQ